MEDIHAATILTQNNYATVLECNINNLEPMHISDDVTSRTKVYDAYGMMASYSIASNSSKASWNTSETKIKRFAKRLTSKYTQVETS